MSAYLFVNETNGLTEYISEMQSFAEIRSWYVLM